MRPEEVYTTYIALKLHFTSDSYDAIKYHYRTSTKPESFLKRRDKYFFAKIGNKYPKREDVIDYLVANFIADDKKWIGDFDEATYTKWQNKLESISYKFKSDLETLEAINPSLSYWLNIKNQYPEIVNYYLAADNDLHFETLIILDILTKFLSKSNDYITETIFWPDFYKKTYKYKSFLLMKVDTKKLRAIVTKVFTN